MKNVAPSIKKEQTNKRTSKNNNKKQHQKQEGAT